MNEKKVDNEEPKGSSYGNEEERYQWTKKEFDISGSTNTNTSEKSNFGEIPTSRFRIPFSLSQRSALRFLFA